MPERNNDRELSEGEKKAEKTPLEGLCVSTFIQITHLTTQINPLENISINITHNKPNVKHTS